MSQTEEVPCTCKTTYRLGKYRWAQSPECKVHGLKCDHCRRPVRVARGLHYGGYRHNDDQPDAEAEWCETKTGYVRVTVRGKRGPFVS